MGHTHHVVHSPSLRPPTSSPLQVYHRRQMEGTRRLHHVATTTVAMHAATRRKWPGPARAAAVVAYLAAGSCPGGGLARAKTPYRMAPSMTHPPHSYLQQVRSPQGPNLATCPLICACFATACLHKCKISQAAPKRYLHKTAGMIEAGHDRLYQVSLLDDVAAPPPPMPPPMPPPPPPRLICKATTEIQPHLTIPSAASLRGHSAM